MSFLKVWGCEAFVKRLVTDKLGPKSDKCNFVGDPKETKGYYFYNRTENKVFVARTAIFLGREMFSRKNSGSMIDLDEFENHRITLNQSWNMSMKYMKVLLLKKHRVFVDLVGFATSLRDIMDFS